MYTRPSSSYLHGPVSWLFGQFSGKYLWKTPHRYQRSVVNSKLVSFAFVAVVHDDVIKWKHFPRYWPFVRETTGNRWVPLTKASDAELYYFLRCAFKLTVEQTLKLPVTWDVIMFMWRHCNDIAQNYVSKWLTSPIIRFRKSSEHNGYRCRGAKMYTQWQYDFVIVLLSPQEHFVITFVRIITINVLRIIPWSKTSAKLQLLIQELFPEWKYKHFEIVWCRKDGCV